MNGRERFDCEGKVAFESFAQAARVAAERRHPGHKIAPYTCRICGKVHLGSTISKMKDKRRKVREAEFA